MAIRVFYFSDVLMPYDASKTTADLLLDAATNDALIVQHYNSRGAHDTWVCDGVFAISQPITDEALTDYPHAITGRNTGHANVNSGFIIMAAVEGIRIAKNYGLVGGITPLGFSHHFSIVHYESLDSTTSIARDVVDVNQASYTGNHHIAKPTLIVDQLSEPSTHTHDMINDNNPSTVVIGYGAGVYGGGGDNDAGHVNTLKTIVNVEVFNSIGVAVDYQDGSSVDLKFLAFNCTYGLVIRGGRWDVNHYFIRGMVSKCKYNPLYIEGNHGTQGAGYDNAVKYTTNSGHIDIKCYDYGKPIVVHGAPERLDLFAEKGAQKEVGGSYSYRFGNYCPVIYMPTATGISSQVVGDSVDPTRIADFTIAGSDISTRYWRWPALINKNVFADSLTLFSKFKDVNKTVAAQIDMDVSRNITTKPYFSNEAYVGLKAATGTVLRGVFNTLNSEGEEVAVLSDLPPAPPEPTEVLRTDFEDGTLQGWSGVSLSVLEVVNGTMRAVKADGAYDRVEFNAAGLVIGNTYRATFTCHVSGSDPAARFSTWSGATIADVVVTSPTPTEYVIEFVPTDATVKMRYYCDNDKNVTTDDFSMDLMVLEAL